MSDISKRQIDDLQSLSREYERQETLRMSRSNRHQDPYINELIPDVGRTLPNSGQHRD